jgi:hypothetical protein
MHSRVRQSGGRWPSRSSLMERSWARKRSSPA